MRPGGPPAERPPQRSVMRGFKDTNRMMGLWNEALSREIKTLFQVEAPHVYLEAAKMEIERIEKEEGVSFVKQTPLDTINAIYRYFTGAGFFEEAGAVLQGEKDERGREVYELYERGCLTFELNHWRLCEGLCASPVCIAHSMIRCALHTGFSLSMDLLEDRIEEGTKEEFARIALKPESVRELKPLRLIEEMKKDKAELNRISGEYRKAIDMSLDAMVSAGEEGRIALWNPAAQKLFGYSEEEMMGQDVSVLVPDALRQRHRQGMERFLKTGEGGIIGRVVELQGLCKDGTVIPVEMSLSAERVDGRWVFMAIIRDDRVRKSLEEELKTRLDETERFTRLMVGREIKMEELRREIAALREKLAARGNGT